MNSDILLLLLSVSLQVILGLAAMAFRVTLSAIRADLVRVEAAHAATVSTEIGHIAASINDLKTAVASLSGRVSALERELL